MARRTIARISTFRDSAQWKGSNFVWRGIQLRNPRIVMTGVVELGPNGYSYRESQFDAGLSGRKTYDMVSLCVEDARSGGGPAIPSIPAPQPPLATPLPFAAEKQRMVHIMNERLAACAEPKMSELVNSGEVAAELTDATIAFCREAVNDLIGAQVILNNSAANKESLRIAIRNDLRAMAVQVRADAQHQ